MTRYYPEGLSHLLHGDLAPATDPVSLVLTTTGFVFNPADDVLGDLTHTQGSKVSLGTVGIAVNPESAWVTTSATPVMPVDPLGDDITGVVLVCTSGGVDYLLSYIDRTADGVIFNRSASGGDITIEFANAAIYGLGG